MNQKVILKTRPTGIAQSRNFDIIKTEIPRPSDGEFLIKNKFLSVEPAMRGWIADMNNYSAPVEIGSVMRALSVGEIIESKHPDYKGGDIITGWFGWQDYCVSTPDDIVRKVQETDLPLSLSLGILGINGVTAYLALTQIGKPREGDTVLVSTAAGAVGSAVGQIAKIFNCRTIGLTGSDEKVSQCTDLFCYDSAINYKTEDLDKALKNTCPDGIDIYYDNTAGAITDAVLHHLAINSRVVICGTAAIPSWDEWPTGPRVERHLLVKRASMQGFVIFDHQDKYDATVTKLAEWIRQGKLQYKEDILNGIDTAPDAIAGLYRGENLGKRIIKLDD